MCRRWIKLGRIFTASGQYDWMQTHAAVPFAEPRAGDVVRVYFSSRDRDQRSHVGWVDVDLRRPDRILALSSMPVLAPGALGGFDDAGAMLSWITPHAGKKYAYYIGWNLGVTVPFRNALGLAISDGEVPFRKAFVGPVLDRSTIDPYFVASACVRVEGALWRMWYLSCVKWERVQGKPRHWYHLRYAESPDGIRWERSGRVCIDFASPAEYAISRPSVVRDADGYKMWFSARGERYRIGYAISDDGLTWQRHDAEAGLDVSPTGWDADMIEYPHVFDHGGRRYLLYNGDGYGRTGFGLAVQEKRP